MNSKKKGMTLATKQKAAGWIFLAPASIMIAIMSFYPMIRAFIISLQTGAGANMRFADPIFSNYKRILADKVFQQSIGNTFLYLIIQVPIMLILAILLGAKLLKEQQIQETADFMLKNMALVFVPLAVGMVEDLELLKGQAAGFLIVVGISLILTFLGTYGTVRLVQKCMSRLMKKGGKKHE